MLQPGTIFDNRYELIKLIGRGGFSEVWLVNDTLTSLKEALKVYAPGNGMDDDGLKIFSKELSIVHDLRHINLLTPKSLGQYENQPYLVLPYCPQGSLKKLVGQCAEEQAWKILEQVAAGLAYLHEQGIVHQDIKPDNILVDVKQHYVITDFGISLRAQSTLRNSMRAQANSGTMAYMAPERFSTEPNPIPANDIWSLGAMMFELIEGNVPFVAQMGGLAQKGGADIPTMHGDVSANLKQVILSMLALKSEERPTAKEIVKYAKSRNEASSTYNNNGEGHKRSGREEEKASQHDVKQDTMPIISFQSNNKAKKEKSAGGIKQDEPSISTFAKTKLWKRIVGLVICFAICLGSVLYLALECENWHGLPLYFITCLAMLLFTMCAYLLLIFPRTGKSRHKVYIPAVVVFNLLLDIAFYYTAVSVVYPIPDFVSPYVSSVTIPADLPSYIVVEEENLGDAHGLSNIYVDAFNPDYCDVDGVLYSKDQKRIIRYPENRRGDSYSIQNGTTKIADDAFSYSRLKEITIPESVVEIGALAFYGCRSLKTLTIPINVKKIGQGAFTYTSLESLTCYAKEPPAIFLLEDVDNFSIPLYVPFASIKKYKTDEEWRSFKDIRSIEQESSAPTIAPDGYVDLGLPSGTYWKGVSEKGLYTFKEAKTKFGAKLPTSGQLEELYNNCKWQQIGNGYKVVGSNGNHITMSYDGVRLQDGRMTKNNLGLLLSSSSKEGMIFTLLYATDTVMIGLDDCRDYGMSVRLVQ
ncbi:MAG: protein kinase [Paludibacteraceae bacterium]|nr:protein kinase [Paludibacteraceae bacterium]MBR6117035.1 protein kinase [Paludibacteraceae bacterium]